MHEECDLFLVKLACIKNKFGKYFELKICKYLKESCDGSLFTVIFFVWNSVL